jgi:hypothetical protein
MTEIYARTGEGQFVVAKRNAVVVNEGEQGKMWDEMYMLVGRKDASLTDAERECLEGRMGSLILTTYYRCRSGIHKNASRVHLAYNIRFPVRISIF